MTLMKNKMTRRHDTAWTAVTRGIGSTLPGNEQWHSRVGQLIVTENATRSQQGEVQEVYMRHLPSLLGPKTCFQCLIVRSVTELGSVEVLKYKHLKTTL